MAHLPSSLPALPIRGQTTAPRLQCWKVWPQDPALANEMWAEARY